MEPSLPCHLAQRHSEARERRIDDPRTDLPDAGLAVGFGRIVASEQEVPILFGNLV
jgi:hypothetical protein